MVAVAKSYCRRPRAFELWRSHPRWYMHRVLVEDCAGRRGCCGCDCGCCLNRDISLKRQLGRRHCTFEYGCCCKARGFKLTPEEVKNLHKQARLDGNMPRYYLMSQASIWGILDGNHDNPFDLIDGPPGYEQTPVSEIAQSADIKDEPFSLIDQQDKESTSTEV